MHVDVVIVGGGPAGAAAAISLANAKRSVLLVDRATFPRDKCCGDGLTTLALRLTEDLGIAPATVPNWQPVDDAVIHGPDGRAVHLTLPESGHYAACVPRVDYDQAVLSRAVEVGVDVRDGHRWRSLDQHDDWVDVDIEGLAPVRTRYLIAADGMWSPIRKSLGAGLDGYRGEWHAFRQYFANVGQLASDHLHVWFETDVLPGYVWSFPLPDGRANVGFGVRRGGRVEIGDMGRLWTDILERPHIRDVIGVDAEPEDGHKAWPIPARIPDAPLASGRVLFVGDAAAATDPLTGEGIGQALLTGMCAADAIIEGGALAPARVGETYTRTVREHLVADHHMSMWLGKALTSARRAELALRIVATSAWTRRNFARWMFEDYPRAALFTPRRWERGMFTRPGAFTSSG